MTRQPAVAGRRFPVRIRTFLAVLATALFSAWTGASLQARQSLPAPARPAAPQRILVKLRPALAQAVEAGMADPAAAIVQGAAPDAAVDGFLRKSRGGWLTALYPELIRMRKAEGLDDAGIAERVRQRFPRRTRHVPHPIPTPEVSRTYLLEVPGAAPDALEALAKKLGGDPQVEFAEVEHVASASYSSNDPYYLSSGSWGQAYADLWGLPAIGAPAAWNLSTGSGILVAVVDTGIDYTHPDIAANYASGGWDFIGASYLAPVQGPDPVDREGHGTHVAGTIAAVGGNGLGILGVAPGAKVMAVKALDDAGYGASSGLAQAILYAANHGADVINASWGGEGLDPAIEEAIQYAYSVGVVFVAAAGNSGEDAEACYPANSPEAITVAAMGPYGAFSGFSNYGPKIDVTAPGEDILSLRAAGTTMGTPVGDGYVLASGTSMAAPHVTGLVALLLAQEPGTPIETLRQQIRASAVRVGADGWDYRYGYGILDAHAALAQGAVLQAHIAAPAYGATVSGAVPVTGSAQGASFDHYLLEYGAGVDPATWIPLQSSSTPVASGSLGTFDARQVPDGTYTLRLTATDSLGRGFADRTEVRVAYLALTSPAPPQCPPAAAQFKPGAQIPIVGSATGPSFQGFRIQWARGVDPASGWSTSGVQLAGGGAAPVSSGQLGTWDTSGITAADYYTVRLLVDDQGFTSQARTLVYLEPSLVSGNWPKALAVAPSFQSGLVPFRDAGGQTRLVLEEPVYGNTSAPPALFEFSPDGASQSVVPLTAWSYFNPSVGPVGAGAGQDIVVPDPAGAVTAFHADGSSTVFRPPAGFGTLSFGFSQIVLADLGSGTGRDVVAFGEELPALGGAGYLFAWHPDGSLLGPRFPISIPNQLFSIGSALNDVPRVLVGDMDGDGVKEFVVVEGLSGSTFTLARFTLDGVPIPWPVPVFDQASGSLQDLALADLDHKGRLDVLVIAGGVLHVLQPDGSERDGWPQAIPGGYGHLAVGDLDLDGSPEIVVASGTALMVYRADGTPFSSAWPQGPAGGWAIRDYGHPILADVDGDGYPEILGSEYSIFTAPPLFGAAVQDAPSPPARLAVRAEAAPDGRLDLQAQPAAAGTLTYISLGLVAVRLDGSIARSWQLLGTGGLPPWNQPVITVGDFDQDGQAEIAVTYYNQTGMLASGTATVLATEAAYHANASPWPMLRQDCANTSTLAGLVLAPGTLPAASPGIAYSQSLTATGGVAPYAFSVGSGSLPPGFSLSPAGLLSGTAGRPGTYAFRIVAVDQANATAACDYTLTVQCPAIGILPAAPPVPVVGAAYSVTFSGTGGTAPYAFALVSGSLPAGLALTGAGLLGGTCSAGGLSSFRIAATDAYGCQGFQDYSLQVATPIVQANAAEAGLLPGVPARFTVTLAGLADAGVAWTATGGSLVPDGTSATFSADAPGTYVITAASVLDPLAAASITVQVHGLDFTHPGGPVCGQDALVLIGAMGGAGTAQDLDGNGRVDGADLDLLLNALGW